MSICGGFFDVPSAQKRLAELDALMAADTFWNNREQAQKLIDEANSLRKKIDPPGVTPMIQTVRGSGYILA